MKNFSKNVIKFFNKLIEKDRELMVSNINDVMDQQIQLFVLNNNEYAQM